MTRVIRQSSGQTFGFTSIAITTTYKMDRAEMTAVLAEIAFQAVASTVCSGSGGSIRYNARMIPLRHVMPIGPWALLLVGCALAMAPASAAAQTMEQRGYRPVDQLHDDVDPLQRSLRVQESGLRTTGERHNVFRARLPQHAEGGRPGASRLFYVAKGIVAEYDRSIYAVDLRRRRILQVIPPNTVFHVGVPEAAPDDQAPPTEAQRRRRAELRIDPTPASRRRTLQPTGMSRPAGGEEPDARYDTLSHGTSYAAIAEGHRRRVAEAIRRLAREAR